MNILFEIADKDLIFIGLALAGIILFAVVIFYVLNKNNKVEPIPEEMRFDNEIPEKETQEFIKEVKPLTQEQQEAKNELERVFNQMSADLEAKNPTPEVIEEFEREQEENAIISYQELIRQAAAKKMNNFEDKISQPKEKSSQEVLANYLHESIPEKEAPVQMELEIKKPVEIKEEPKKFRNSDIISPIFGIQNPQPSPACQKKVEAEAPRHAYEELKVAYDSENNAEFLNSLKEFRKNL